MLQTAARHNGARRVDGRTSFFNRNDLPLRVDDESRAVGQVRGAKYAVLLHHVTLVIGQHRELSIEFLGPVVESRYEIAANGQDLRFRVLEFAYTRLVGGEFAGSTTGKRGGEEGQHDVLLAAKIGEFHGMIGVIG